MRRLSVSLIAVACTAMLLSASSSARAAGDDDDDSAVPFQFGAGVIGVMGANFLNKPDDMTIKYQGTSVATNTYPGFGGVSSGAGLMLEGRFISLLGLEIDIVRSSDHGHGDLTINGRKFTITVGQSAWHVPVLLKLVAPLPVVRPMVFLGPEFVRPSAADAKVEPAGFLTQVAATSDSYTMLTAGIGMEFKLPIPGIDLRIPFTLRGGYNPSVKNTLEERATYSLRTVTLSNGQQALAIDKVEYKSAWRYQTYATLAVAAYF